MGKRTSIYITDELQARIEASGLKPRALVIKGLDSLKRDEIKTLTAEIRELRNEVRAVLRRLS